MICQRRASFSLGACLLFSVLSYADDLLAQSAAPVSTPARKAAPARAKRTPMTTTEVEKLWAPSGEAVLVNDIRLRGLIFEPDEEWMTQLEKRSSVRCDQVPTACKALKDKIPLPPNMDEVTKQAPIILLKLKDAAQKKDVDAMQSLVHPELLTDKAKLYELFDPSNYRGHTLGRFTTENRRVGVQFFELTLSQVETVHYVWFSLSKGKIAVRDIETGPQVAERFLRDEQKLALAKLDLVFRALNDGDEAGLKTLCTPGLYQSIQELGGDRHPGDRITRGHGVSQVGLKPSVPLDQKSVRVVVRVTYPLRSGKPLEFDVDFERIENDLKVVRLRDVENHVIAWDPDMDNYLNRRYSIPDGPKQMDVAKTTIAAFFPLSMIRTLAMRAIDDRKAQDLMGDAQEVIDSAPQSGEGEGFLASANYILGKDDEAEQQAMLAIPRGGTVYLTVLRHSAVNLQGQPFSPVTLGISKDRISYTPVSGSTGAPEEIAISAISVVELEHSRDIRGKRPFLKVEFHNNAGKKQTYNFAAFGTSCAGQTPAAPNLIIWTGTSVCGGNGTTVPQIKWPPVKIPIPNSSSQVATMVPRSWEQDIKVVMRTIEEARKATTARKSNP